MRSWIEVSEERLQGNLRVLAQRAGPSTAVMAVVKSNAYGHGAERCAVALSRVAARWFGVADVREGARVRAALDNAGAGDAEILVMCGLLPEDAGELAEARLTPVIWAAAQARWLQGGLPVHVELETGMGRQGCRTGEELDQVLDAMQAAGVRLGGLMTHFCEAEVAGSAKTRAQQTEFERGVEQVRRRGLRTEWVHAGTSSSLDDPSWDPAWLTEVASRVGARPMVRCGIGLYGYVNRLEGATPQLRGRLMPVMAWKTRVLDLHQARAGDCIGYNGTFRAAAAMKLALLPVGYADGLRRALSSTSERRGGWAMLRGARAPIVGRVSMNLTMVDVSGIDGAAAGDEVLLLGEGVTADDHARIAGTIAYEILCGVGEG